MLQSSTELDRLFRYVQRRYCVPYFILRTTDRVRKQYGIEFYGIGINVARSNRFTDGSRGAWWHIANEVKVVNSFPFFFSARLLSPIYGPAKVVNFLHASVIWCKSSFVRFNCTMQLHKRQPRILALKIYDSARC